MHCYHYNGAHNHVTKHWIDPVSNNYANMMAKGLLYWTKFLESISEEDLKKYYEYSGVDYINGIIEERAFTRQIIDPNATGTPDSKE